jgi:flagellar protein FliT
MNMERQAMILDYYEQVRDTSTLMLEAARASDWDSLVTRERQCAAIIGRLQACGGDDADLLDEQGKRRAHEIIRAILRNDAEIRDLTQPWLRQLEAHLGTARMGRRVAAAYRS